MGPPGRSRALGAGVSPSSPSTGTTAGDGPCGLGSLTTWPPRGRCTSRQAARAQRICSRERGGSWCFLHVASEIRQPPGLLSLLGVSKSLRSTQIQVEGLGGSLLLRGVCKGLWVSVQTSTASTSCKILEQQLTNNNSCGLLKC